ncbi:MAG: nucleotidyl transferase AbiEii/AbiGii toxin family protein [Candidatus Binataceae bacterium]
MPAAQKRLWPELRPARGLGFVLYGGTAIALRLGHRFSVDFDFFTEKTLHKRAIKTSFPFVEKSTVLQDTPDTFTVLVSTGRKRDESVKVSFFGTIDFGRIGEPELTEDGVLQVAALEDLLATKLKVILQRAEARDYKDIVEILKAGGDLARGLAGAQALYGKSFQPSESLKALVYFDGGDLATLSRSEKQALVNAARTVRKLPHIQTVARKLALP